MPPADDRELQKMITCKKIQDRKIDSLGDTVLRVLQRDNTRRYEIGQESCRDEIKLNRELFWPMHRGGKKYEVFHRSVTMTGAILPRKIWLKLLDNTMTDAQIFDKLCSIKINFYTNISAFFQIMLLNVH